MTENVCGAASAGFCLSFWCSPLLGLIPLACFKGKNERRSILASSGLAGIIASFVFLAIGYGTSATVVNAYSWQQVELFQIECDTFGSCYDIDVYQRAVTVMNLTIGLGFTYIAIGAILVLSAIIMSFITPKSVGVNTILPVIETQKIMSYQHAPQIAFSREEESQVLPAKSQGCKIQAPKMLSMESLAIKLDIPKLLESDVMVDDLFAMDFKELRQKFDITFDQFSRLKKYKEAQ